MSTFLWHPLTPKCTWPSQNKFQKTLRKYWENFFRNYAPFYIQGGHNYGNYCTWSGWTCLQLSSFVSTRVTNLLQLARTGRMKSSKRWQVVGHRGICGWEGGGRQEGTDGNGWTVGLGGTRTGTRISQKTRRVTIVCIWKGAMGHGLLFFAI